MAIFEKHQGMVGSGGWRDVRGRGEVMEVRVYVYNEIHDDPLNAPIDGLTQFKNAYKGKGIADFLSTASGGGNGPPPFPVSFNFHSRYHMSSVWDGFVSIGIRVIPTFRGSNTWSGGLRSGGLDPKRGVPTMTNVAVTNKSRSGDLWSGGLDRKEVPTVTNIAVTNEDVGSSKRGVLL
ncbi:hypothetical protein LXL04_013513 [Taraxacum kok-saghyz]